MRLGAQTAPSKYRLLISSLILVILSITLVIGTAKAAFALSEEDYITTNITEGQSVGGVTVVNLTTSELAPSQYSIQIFDMDGHLAHVGDVPQAKVDTAPTSHSFSYSWDTTPLENADYRIRLAVKNALGHESAIFRTVLLNNMRTMEEIETVTPALTLNDKLDGKIVAGTINMTGATFVVKIDDVLRDTITVQVGDKKDDKYPWSFVLPDDITVGEMHHLRVEATREGANAEPKIMVFQLEPAQGGSQEIMPIKEDPVLKEMSATLTQPFPTPQAFTTIFMPPSEEEQKTAAIKSSPPLAKLIKQPLIDRHTSSLPAVATSEQGWRIWGVLWYWWVIGSIASVMLWQIAMLVKRRLRERHSSPTFMLDTNDM